MRSASPLDRVVDLLSATGSKPRRSGSQWIARCPAHPDRRPSLSLGQTDAGVVLLHCLAGCATDDLCGYWETVDGERKREPGILEAFDITSEEADGLIIWARVTEGWIEDPAEIEAEEEGEAEEGEEAGESGNGA